MLESKFTNCKKCGDIDDLLKRINCKLTELSYNMYNNVVFMLNKCAPTYELTQLLKYREILTKKKTNLTVYTKTYKVGDLLGGGAVVKVLPDNEYLVVSLLEYNNYVGWSLSGDYDFISGAVGKEIGDGQANTDAIIAMYGEDNYAASQVRSFYGSDWNLPSKDELYELYITKSTLEAVPGFEPFDKYFYWSSTQPNEILNPEFYAWGVSYPDGNQNTPNKILGSGIRGVKIYKEEVEELSDSYVEDFTVEDIAGKVIRLTAGCSPRCPEVNPVCISTTSSTTTINCSIESGEIECVTPPTTTTTTTIVYPYWRLLRISQEDCSVEECPPFLPCNGYTATSENLSGSNYNIGDYVRISTGSPLYDNVCWEVAAPSPFANDGFIVESFSNNGNPGSCDACFEAIPTTTTTTTII